ncbi:hypothetical protein A2U01_0073778, partial [Trifolium medium]|nr:hypothetical protein [Trifolium medium]
WNIWILSMTMPLFVAGTHFWELFAERDLVSLSEIVASARHGSLVDWKLTDFGRWLLAE